MRTTLRPAVAECQFCGSVAAVVGNQVPLRRALIFSTEFVFGPAGCQRRCFGARPRIPEHTNSANDGGATIIFGGDHLRVELGEPLQLHAVAEMVEGSAGGHFGECEQLARL